MFFISLIGSILMHLTEHLNLGNSALEIFIFIVQIGISSSFVTVNVAVLILISVNHRLRVFTILSLMNIGSLSMQPLLVSYIGHDDPAFYLIGATTTAVILSCLISHRGALRAN